MGRNSVPGRQFTDRPFSHQLDQLRGLAGPAVDLDDLFDWWLCDAPMAVATVDESATVLKRMLQEGFSMAAFEASPESARREVRRYMAGQKRAGTSGFTLRQMGKVHNRLARYMASRLEDWEGVKWTLVPEPKVEGRKLRRDQVNEALQLPATRRVRNLIVEKRRRALVYVAVHTGLRRGELARIRVSDLDEARVGIWLAHPTKRGTKRLLWLPEDAFSPKRPLKAWLRVRPVDETAPDALWTRQERDSKQWRTFNARDVTSEFSKLGKQLGYHVCPTMLRRNDTQLLDEKGVHPRVIQRRRGHATIATTMRYLGEVSAERELKDLRRAKVPGYRRPRT